MLVTTISTTLKAESNFAKSNSLKEIKGSKNKKRYFYDIMYVLKMREEIAGENQIYHSEKISLNSKAQIIFCKHGS